MLAYGIISLLVGMLAIAMPVPATFAATIVTGAYILAAGLASLLAGIFGKGYEGRFYAIAIGLISLIGGGIMMFQPTIGAASLTLLIASFLIVR
ncbi:MAG: DUF308 domain-containing protein, partial [Sphingomonas sp.]|nr:DUF308 domain-containing protein [Sphingomonas sp.]